MIAFAIFVVGIVMLTFIIELTDKLDELIDAIKNKKEKDE